MLGIFLIILSGILVGFCVKLLGEILELKKYLVNIEKILRNFFLVFCVIFLISLISWSVFGDFGNGIINQEVVNLVFNF